MQQNILEVLLDENNHSDIRLKDAKGQTYIFRQVAVIPMEEKVYAVLKPLVEMENVADDEAIVFYVHEEEGKEPVLMMETDEPTARKVFEEYYKLLDES